MKQYGLVLLLSAVVVATIATSAGKLAFDLFDYANERIQNAVGGLR